MEKWRKEKGRRRKGRGCYDVKEIV